MSECRETLFPEEFHEIRYRSLREKLQQVAVNSRLDPPPSEWAAEFPRGDDAYALLVLESYRFAVFCRAFRWGVGLCVNGG